MNSISGAQVNTYTYDATGNARTESAALGTAINPTGATALSYTFDARNRLKQVQIGATATDTVTYKVNGLGQRYQKTGSGQFLYNSSATVNVTTGLSPQAESLAYNARYVYDEQGRLLGEYSPEGKLIQETIWLDDLPVATIRPKGSNIQTPQGLAGTGANAANNTGKNTSSNPVNVELYYLHPDHLGTPRVATRSAAVNGATSGPNAINKAVWRWDSDPFGTSLGNSRPNENPQNVTGTASKITAASFRVNNRFPGQIADAESGKYYNYLRDYDSVIGRYTESDPIGLRGGLSTFGYVGERPLLFGDPYGLRAIPPVDPSPPGWPYFPPGPESPDTRACDYYARVCQSTGCRYYCYTAPLMCRSGAGVPFFWGVGSANLNCVRRCLAREDDRARSKRETSSCFGGCLTDSEIDQYHSSCYLECNVDPKRYPGVNPPWLPVNPNPPSR